MPNYRYNTPDYMRQNNSNGRHVGGSRTMPASVSPSTPSRSCCNIHEHDKIKRAPNCYGLCSVAGMAFSL